MRLLLALAACIAVVGIATPASPAGGPLETGLVATVDFRGPDADLAYSRARAAGATFIRIYTSWEQIGATEPAKGSNARDPGNPAYDWSSLDDALTRTRTHKLTPIINVLGAPRWAWGRRSSQEPGDGAVRPSLTALADFSAAAAERYSGRSPDRPRVKYWQLWNEPNLSVYFKPQFEEGRLVSTSWYRAMTNVFYAAVHAANNSNSVIAGGLAPFGGANAYYVGVAPLRFMRDFLCMSAGDHPRPTCARKVKFDIWATHPYTSGGPTHSALNPDDVSLGDLPEMKRLLNAARRAGHVVSNQRIRFWVTEFSWDSQPGDAKGVPARLHARWVSEGLYRMWQNGVSQVTWFNIRDSPFISGLEGLCQCGLWLRGKGGLSSDTKKLSLQAFRFPFVAFLQTSGSVSFWGRTPTSDATTLVIEQRVGSNWVRLTSSTSAKRGIFAGTVLPGSKSGAVRARVVATNEASVPFSLSVPADLPLCAFGTC